jgi:hypothetical protein
MFNWYSDVLFYRLVSFCKLGLGHLKTLGLILAWQVADGDVGKMTFVLRNWRPMLTTSYALLLVVLWFLMLLRLRFF